MRFFRKHCIVIFPVVLILSLSVAWVLSPAKTFSKNEKRYLAQCPKLSIESVLSGKFSEKFEAYFSDQFPLRDFWIFMEKRFEI